MAQEEARPERTHHYLGAGLGLYTGDLGPWIQYDHGLSRAWSIGLVAGTLSTYKIWRPNIFFSLRGNYHFNTLIKKMPKNMDWYFGAGMGPKLTWNLQQVWILFTIHSGYRYLFYNNLGLQIEVLGGFNMNGLNVGLIWKI